jgi:hypothetical protein
MDDIDFIIVDVSDTSKDILQNNEAKQDTMYEIIEEELKGVQKAIHSIHAVSIMPPSSKGVELGDKPTQLRCDRSSPSSCPGGKRIGHRGLKEIERGSQRTMSGYAIGKR